MRISCCAHDDGRWYIGASSALWLEESDRVKLAGSHFLMHTAFLEINREFFYCDVELVGNGYRPTTIDFFPLLGESHINGIWFNNGMKRDGFTSSPYTSNELSKAILGEENTLSKRFKPSRKLISYKTKEEAIKATEDFYQGMDMHHGGAPDAPHLFQNYKNTRLGSVRNAYRRRKFSKFGIHPETIHLYENDDFYKCIKHKREFN